MSIQCAALKPAPVYGEHIEPQWDGTHTIVTGWIQKAGPEPAGYVDPCPNQYHDILVGKIPIHVTSCVSEPSPQLNHWFAPQFDGTYTHVTGWTSTPGVPPVGYVNPCTGATAIPTTAEPLVFVNPMIQEPALQYLCSGSACDQMRHLQQLFSLKKAVKKVVSSPITKTVVKAGVTAALGQQQLVVLL